MTEQIVDLDTDPVGAMPAIYNHPKLRDLSQTELYERLEDVRNRRLLAAMDFKDAHTKKMMKLGHKLASQWEDLNQKNLVKLHKIDEAITALEKAVEKQVGIHHKLTMAEEGIDL
jgi:hypothetical protein